MIIIIMIVTILINNDNNNNDDNDNNKYELATLYKNYILLILHFVEVLNQSAFNNNTVTADTSSTRLLLYTEIICSRLWPSF